MQINQGLRLVHSGSVTQANMKSASINAGAMIDIGVDWSAYAGDDAGSTPHMLILYDSAGKRLQGFIGASGGGEALGAELIINSDFANWTGDDPDNWIVENEDANNYVTESPAGVANIISNNTAVLSLYQGSLVVTANKLYKVTIVVTINTLGWRGYFPIIAKSFTNFTNDGTLTFYGTNEGSTTINFYRHNEGACNFELDSVSLKQITDISTNGVHLHSTKGATNRNVASIDSAFDLNDPSGFTFKIYACP
jgi:hypothetical protein